MPQGTAAAGATVLIVPSAQFLAFAALSALVFNLSRGVRWRQAVLLFVNLAFLASFAPSFSHGVLAFLPFAAFIAFGYASQRAAGGASYRVFIMLVVVTLLLFFWLKRYGFVPAATFLPFAYLLVGLSYVFFRVLHVIIDRHQGVIEGRIGLLSYLNYTLNFTSLVSGPIQFYEDYRRTEIACLPLDLVAIGCAVERIVVGYFKVAVVSLLLSTLQHGAVDGLSVSGNLAARVWYGALVAAIYPIYLYFNFSGYVDVVIGVARFFRLELPENFDHPFSSENFIAFWGRWHITLSSWLRTYVYNPLVMAGLRRTRRTSLAPYVTVAAFFVTFFLVGFWHGQTSEFVFFGILQGGGVAANKLYQIQMEARLGRAGYQALAASPLYKAAARGLTFTWFTFTLLWFWSDWRHIFGLFSALGPLGLALAWLSIFAGATVVLAALDTLRQAALRVTWHGRPALASRYVRTSWNTALIVVTISLTVLMNLPAPDIVYKTF